jgi:zinc transport system substrate-binding protein
MAVPGLTLFPVRVGGAWEHHDHDGEDHEGEDHEGEDHEGEDHDGAESELGHGGFDPHVWLDPRNARRIVANAAAVLSEIDPGNAAAYQANAARLDGELTGLEAELAGQLAPVRGIPFIVFHDAYHGFEARFGLNAVGAFALTPGTAPGARRVAELRARIVEAGAACVFVEPQFEPAIVRAAVAGTSARVAVLDPLGATLPPGPAAYAQLLRGLADSLSACLSG